MSGDIIDDFRGANFFLSNFHVAPFKFVMPGILDEEREYPSVEHAFQAAKSVDVVEQRLIALAASPREAKTMGRAVKDLRPNWDYLRLEVMRSALAYKFYPGTELAFRLVGTDDAFLIEGNQWGDDFWGQVQVSGRGANWLGWLLMAQRAYLRAVA